MTRGRAIALLLLMVSTLLLAAARPAAADDTTVGAALSLRVVDVLPNSPAISQHKTPLVFTLEVTNSSDVPVAKVVVGGNRSDPISSESALRAELSHPTPPHPELAGKDLPSRTVAVPAHSSREVTIVTTTSTETSAGICLCHQAIYPVYFTATWTDAQGQVRTTVAQTYIPAFNTAPTPMQVTWVWPLLDRPHRLAHSDLFTDDDLAREVAPDGRLNNLLSTLERVRSSPVRMTVLIDPELIDELITMSQGYQYWTDTGLVTGSGGAAASIWLSRLRAVLTDQNIELAATPYADPAVDSLSRHDLSWANVPDSAFTQRVEAALGRPLQFDMSWPNEGFAHPITMARLRQHGVRTVLLADTAFRGNDPTTPAQDALTTIATPHSELTGAVLSTSLENAVEAATAQAPGLSAVPDLVASLALQVVEAPTAAHSVVLAPSRYADVDPISAARAMEATTSLPWARSIGLRAAVSGGVTPAARAPMRTRLPTPGIPGEVARAVRSLQRLTPPLTALFARPADAAARLGGLPAAEQRVVATGLLGDPTAARANAQVLRRMVDALRRGVQLVHPAVGTYTLTSRDAELPVTIDNRLDVPVRVRLRTSREPGFSTPGIDKLHVVPAGQRVEVKIAAHVDQVRRIQLRVYLDTPGPDHLQLGQPIELTVRSTVLGTIGIVITIVAGAVLALALVYRFSRLWRKRRSNGGGATPPPGPTTTPSGDPAGAPQPADPSGPLQSAGTGAS